MHRSSKTAMSRTQPGHRAVKIIKRDDIKVAFANSVKALPRISDTIYPPYAFVAPMGSWLRAFLSDSYLV